MSAHQPFSFDLHGEEILDSSLEKLRFCHPKNLRLSSCPNVTEKGLQSLFELGEIQTLSLISCPQLTDRTLELIASHLKTLQSLELSNLPNLSDYALSMLLASCQSLKTLSINQCEGFGDQVIFAIALFGKNIDSLRLSANENLTEKGLINIPKNLKMLNVSSNPQLSNAVCQNLMGSSRHLSYFDASFCSQLSIPVAEIGPHPSVRILNLRGCPLDDASLEVAIKQCRFLTHLYLAYSSITDKSLQTLAQNHPKLEVLDLSRCFHLTDAGVEKIFQFCRSLHQLNTLGCPLLSPKYHSFFRLKQDS